MGPTMYFNEANKPILDDVRTYCLDPWHKMQLGWVEPRIRILGTAGSDTLHATQMARPDAPIILYDPARGVGEFFMIEYKNDSF